MRLANLFAEWSRGRDDHRWSRPGQIRTSAFTHTALASDVWRQSALEGKGAELAGTAARRAEAEQLEVIARYEFEFHRVPGLRTAAPPHGDGGRRRLESCQMLDLGRPLAQCLVKLVGEEGEILPILVSAHYAAIVAASQPVKLTRAIRTGSGDVLCAETGSLYPALHRLEPNALIFAAPRGGRILHDGYGSTVLDRVRIASKISDLTYRMLGTTFATLYDGDAKDLQVVLGHHSAVFSMNRDRKVVPERAAATTEELDARLSAKVVPIRKGA